MRGLAVAAGVVVLAGCAPATGPADRLAGTLTVVAAASLTDVFDDLAGRFEEQHPGVEVVVGYGASSALAQQLLSGAPADVVASADESVLAPLAAEGLVEVPVVFAENSLTLAVPAGNPGGVSGLADSRLTVALCDPVVPCGSAAERLLERSGVVASVDTFAEDARAALTQVALGEVDAALVYRTDVLAAAAVVEGVDVPEADAVVNRYPIARLRGARNPAAAQAFIDFVLGPVGREVLADAGFGIP